MTTQQLSALLNRMTPEEKLAQLTQLNPVCFGFNFSTPLTGPDFGLRMPHGCENAVGSVLNCDNASDMMHIQKEHLLRSTNSIPLLFMADIIHGFKTIFPIPLAIGCSFSPRNMQQSASIAAQEAAVSGIHVTFSPMSDLVRDSRWGRVMESTGEDPYLNSLMSAAAVAGYQGNNPAEHGRMVACVKHFAAYGVPEGGREYNTVELSDSTLHNEFLPAYKAALDAGAKMVMSSFNTIDGIPATANQKLLRGTLRESWGFDGVVISDFNSVGELIAHGVAEDGREAALKSLAAGVDIEMMSTHYAKNGTALLLEKSLSPEVLDEAVMRILTLKNDLGLFENPYKDANPEHEKELHLCSEHLSVARRIAQECAVLLKNEDVLPLAQNKKIGLAGPFSISRQVLGGWSAGNKEGISLYEGLCTKFSENDIVLGATSELGSLLDGETDISLSTNELTQTFSDCDVVIVAVGENQNDTGEGASKTNLRLSSNQEKLIHILKNSGKSIITVIFSGRPLEILPIIEDSDAILQAWFLGSESGNALADLLVGDAIPSGKLSMSFPYTVGQVPIYYNHMRTGRPIPHSGGGRYVSRYLDCPVDPLYCFGYGLSYARFAYSEMRVNTNHGLSVSANVENISQIDGIETVQFYIHDCSASITRPIQQLKGVQKVFLRAGECQTVTFTISREMLSFYSKSSLVFECGEFELMIGTNSAQVLCTRIYINEDLVL